MKITLSIIELIIGLGGFVALIFTISLMLRTRRTSLAGIWLTGFFLANIFTLFVKVLHSSGYIIDVPHLLKWKYPIGLSRPVLFFLFIHYLYQDNKKFRPIHLLHFLPVASIILYFSPFYLASTAHKAGWLQGAQLLPNASLPGSYFYFITLYSAAYLTASLRSFLRNKHLTQQPLNALITIIFAVTIGFLLTAFLNTVLGSQIDLTNIMYLILVGGFLIGSIIILGSEKNLKISHGYKYQNSKIDEVNSKQIFESVRELLTNEKLFKDPQLRLAKLAAKINTPAYLVSHAINLQAGISYNDLINKMRIEEAKKLILDQRHQHWTLDAVGYEVGFNSRSAFYSAFKKTTNSTPSAFKKTITA